MNDVLTCYRRSHLRNGFRLSYFNQASRSPNQLVNDETVTVEERMEERMEETASHAEKGFHERH